MTLLPLLIELLNQRKTRLLLVAEAALPASQYEAFRKIVLDELGKSGYQKDVEDALKRIKDR